MNSINPFRLEGQKTAAMEICDQLGFSPQIHALPVGNAGNITACGKAIRSIGKREQVKECAGCLDSGCGRGPSRAGPCGESPQTVASAIRVEIRRVGAWPCKRYQFPWMY
ncbi:MAG: hypothetical protein R3B83_02935 [Nitrospirales bacterium]|nr:hypothetical protein [Nitrospirales bacterium]